MRGCYVKPSETVLAIPDLHCPFQHPDTYAFLHSMQKSFKPDQVVCLGDEVDFHAVSQHDKDPDGFSPGDELVEAIAALKPIYKIFPDVMVCTSNHTSRPYRQAYKFGLPKAFLKDYSEFLQAPKGWKWSDSWEIDGVLYEHGEAFAGRDGAIKSALANMQSTVIGHLHSWAGIQYSANPRFLIFGFNVGCLIDRDRYAFAYGKKMKAKPIVGAGIIKKGIPTFIPMQLDKHGRWTGAL